jgi:ribonuclease D
MGLNIQRDRLCVLQISNGDGNAHIIKFDINNYSAPNLKKLLTNDSTKIMHYARFDLAIIQHYLDVKIDKVFCTKIASRIARTYTDSHGLKELCRELIGINISKQQQSSDWGDDKISDDQLNYAASDVLYLHQIRDILSNMLIRENRKILADESFSFLQTRVMLDLSGWSYDIFAH